jgi:hypothetical protein
LFGICIRSHRYAVTRCDDWNDHIELFAPQFVFGRAVVQSGRFEGNTQSRVELGSGGRTG